ncbi:stonustoxin subunit beta-like [Myripristis murdjan]|uniref:stonustoxin subunit beta-like n=1 Tax=Myripristis murdjan TaxID=586833 RepID=UPI0011760F96|nr:stonustoxin subunit beta-like [Myripristis murdjan]
MYCCLNRLSFCGITMEGSVSLASALKSNPTAMKELDLSYNNPGEIGVNQLSSQLQDPFCSLERLNVEHAGECWLKSGLKKHACQLTLDPDTAYDSLCVRNGRILPSWMEEPDRAYKDNPEKFDSYGQVLCKEGLTGHCYWEVDLHRGEAVVGVAYKGISRKGKGNECKLGHNDKSWCVSFSSFCSLSSGITAWHNDVKIPVKLQRRFYLSRIGVFLDWLNGTLSYYWITSGTLTHLYTFHAEFTEPLYPAFRVWGKSTIKLVDSKTARNPISRLVTL